jgi:hypothetical protein
MTPTGSVVFWASARGGCERRISLGVIELTANGNAVLDDFSGYDQDIRTPHILHTTADYTGDFRYQNASSNCGRLEITKATPTIDFVMHDTDHHVVDSVPTGTEVHASVQVSGRLEEKPTGEVHVVQYSRRNCRGTGHAESEPLVSGAAEVGPFVGPVEGATRSYQVYYAGDEWHYLHATSECLNVTFVEQATPTPAPTPTPTAAPEPTEVRTPPPTRTAWGTPSTSPAETAVPSASPTDTTSPPASPVPLVTIPAQPPDGGSSSGASGDLLPWLLLAGIVLLNLVVGAFLIGRRLGSSPG